jgi:hypothetical protein
VLREKTLTSRLVRVQAGPFRPAWLRAFGSAKRDGRVEEVGKARNGRASGRTVPRLEPSFVNGAALLSWRESVRYFNAQTANGVIEAGRAVAWLT